jgi:predicted  nucleic acid-binding Zn-ribbon protein
MTHPSLAALQLVDTELDTARRRLTELDALVANHSALDSLVEVARSAESDATLRRGQLRDRELELQTLETRIGEIDKRLYGGRIQNPKELENLDREVRMFRENRGRLEESVLQLLELSEHADVEALAKLNQLEIAQAERERDMNFWQAERELVGAKQLTLNAKASALRQQADSSQLDVYDRVRRRNTLAVTTVHGQQCGVCGITLPVAVVDRARDPDAIAQCDNCSRILSVPDAQSDN